MRRAVGILATALPLVFAASLVVAAEPSAHGSGTASGMSGYMGVHTMTGKITGIDKDKGTVNVQTGGEELKLHFPENALRNMNTGEEVTVTLGIKPAGGTSGTSGMGKEKSGTGSHGSEGGGSHNY